MTGTSLDPREVRHPSGLELRRTRIAPRDYTASRLVAELADAWKGYCEAMELSPGSVSGCAAAVRHVGRYLMAAGDRFLTLTDSGTSTLSRLHDWECAAIGQFPPPSGRAKDLGEAVRRFVRYFLQGAGIDSSPLVAWAASPVLDSSTQSAPPLDEFSNRERLLLLRRLREVVRDGERLLALGDSLLAGADPGGRGRDRLGNLLWGLRHSPPGAGAAPAPGGWPLSFGEIAGRVQDVAGIRLPPCSPRVAAGRLLFPSDHHLAALRILIHLETGWAPEETKWLTRADVQFSGRDVRVHTIKNRAGRQRWCTLPARADGAVGWGAGDLFQRAQQAMHHAHALSAGREWFWACGGRCSPVGVPVAPDLSVRRCSFNGKSSLAGLARAYDITVSAPVDLRRTRKTVKSARAVLLGTLAGAAGDDHSVEVFRNHYLPTTTVNTVAARTVIRAQNKVLARATGPTLIPADAATLAAAGHGGRIGQLAQDVAGEHESERDLSVAACADPYRPPHATGRQLCTSGPSMCLRCPNAVVFSDHLPRLLHYRQVLTDHQRSLPPQQFRELFGQQLVNLREIIGTFPEGQVQTAAAQHTDLHIPLAERHQHR